MHNPRVVGVVVGFAMLFLCSLLVWSTFQRYSHSATDTLLDYIITMAPIWAGALGGAWAWLDPADPQTPD